MNIVFVLVQIVVEGHIQELKSEQLTRTKMKTKLLILAIALSSCEATEIPKPVSVEKLTASYSINHQPHTGVFNQYVPNLKTNEK